ncbi:rab GTPase [Mrakia frigida]|uniref:rab GTPase n=1 Tax=Mrakia frigida TaxID=29902 RepID=UPI003FCC10E6
MSSTTWDYILKFVIVGEASTGKSSILRQLTEASFTARSEPTLGVEFGSKVLAVDMAEGPEAGSSDAQVKLVKVQTWDVAGTPSFRSITRSYYRGSAGALLVYDVTSKQSFLELSSWLTDLRKHADAEVVIILCANKHDLVEQEDATALALLAALTTSEGGEESEARAVPKVAAGGKSRREVSRAEGEEFAKREGLMFVECSAKSGLGVNEAFDRTAREILLKIQRGLFESTKPGGIKLSGSKATSMPSDTAAGGRGGCC